LLADDLNNGVDDGAGEESSQSLNECVVGATLCGADRLAGGRVVENAMGVIIAPPPPS